MGLSTVIYFLVNPWVGLTGVVVFGGGTALWYLNHPWFEAKRLYDARRVEYDKALKCSPDRFRKVAESILCQSDTGYDVSKEPFMQYMITLADEIYRRDYQDAPFPEFPPFDLGYNRMMLSMVAEDMETALTWVSGEVTRANLTINLIQYVLELPYEFFHGLGFDGPFRAPLYELIPDIGAMVHQMVAIPFEDKYTSAEVGSSVRTTLRENITAASGGGDRDLIMPGQFDGTPLEVVTAYLRGTGFEEVFTGLAPPLVFSETLRASHGVIIAGTDGGKSQTLENLILADLDQDDPPGMVVIDSKAGPKDLLQRIARLDVFHPDHGRLRDRLVIIDPRV
jgi:hypothetical protein